MPESRSLRVLIVDDDPHFLDAVEALLERAEQFEVVGRAANGEAAYAEQPNCCPTRSRWI